MLPIDIQIMELEETLDQPEILDLMGFGQAELRAGVEDSLATLKYLKAKDAWLAKGE